MKTSLNNTSQSIAEVEKNLMEIRNELEILPESVYSYRTE